MRNPLRRRDPDLEPEIDLVVWDEFEAWFDEQSPERVQLAAQRAMKAGDWDIIPDEDSPLAPSFVADMDKQLVLMMVDDTMDGLWRKGLADKHVMEDGSIGYTLTERGHETVLAHG